MYPAGYYQSASDLMVTFALEHMMFGCKCLPMNQRLLNKSSKEYNKTD